jgi:diaminobutyrate-2-oxoglutarate transaminase
MSSVVKLEVSENFHKQTVPDFKGTYNISPDAYILNQELHESEVRSYPRRIPITINQANGVLIQDTSGYSYIDCLAGAGALPLGYNHPEINDEIITKLKSGIPYQALDITTPTKDAFIKEIMGFLPKTFAAESCIQFCGPSGSDAVEAAIKLSKLFTGRNGVFSFHGAYHGMTNGSMALTGNLNTKSRRTGLMPDVTFFPYPYSLRCKFGLGGEMGEKASIRYLESVLYDQESGIVKPAAIILEPIQGEGGVIPASAKWLQEIRRIASEQNIVLIFDEIQCGIGRTGQNFAFEYSGIEPDVLVMSKAIGGGLPLSCLVFKKKFDCWNAGEHTGTFRGNQLAMATGAKTLQIIKRDNLVNNALLMGNRLITHLREFQKIYPCIAEVRGKGLMIGVEIVKVGLTNTFDEPIADSDTARRIQRAALEHGLIIEIGGRHGAVLRFLPPLIINCEQIDYVAWAFAQAIKVCADRKDE